MEWWQEILRLIANLGWWRISLLLAASILVGILIGLSVSYLIMRFVLKRRVTFFDVFYALFSKKAKVLTPSDSSQQFIDTPTAPPKAHEPTKLPIPELLVEIEHNLKIAAQFSGDNPLPLQSDVWDAGKHSAHKLSANLRKQLKEAYSDIQLLNHIAWLSTELNYRSSFLDELYKERLTSVAERLQRIKQNVE
jgi:hypothetical protein